MPRPYTVRQALANISTIPTEANNEEDSFTTEITTPQQKPTNHTPYVLICPICFLNDNKKLELKVMKYPQYETFINRDGFEDTRIKKHTLYARCNNCNSLFKNLSKKIIQEKYE